MTLPEVLQTIRLPIVGVMAYVVVSQAWLAVRRRESLHVWLALIALDAAVYETGRWWHNEVHTPSLAMPNQLQFAMIILLIPLGLGVAGSLDVRRPWWLRPMQLLGLVTAATPWMGTLLLRREAIAFEDALGYVDYTRHLSPSAALALIPCGVTGAATIYLLARRSLPNRFAAPIRRLLMVSAIAIGLAVINDLLLVAGRLPTIRLVEYALFVLVVGISYVVGRRAADIFTDLETAVAERTHELERANAGLEAALHNVRSLIDNIPDSVLVCRDGSVILANLAARGVFVSPAHALIGRRFEDLVIADETAAAAALIGEASDQARAPRELRFASASAESWVGEVACLSLSFEGAPAVVVIIRDIGERTRLQRQLVLADRLASVGTLAAGVAHEINNPLVYVMANIEAVREDVKELARAPSDPLLAQIVDALNSAEDGAVRVRDIVRDMRMFARTDSGEAGPIDVNRTVTASLNLVRNEIRHRASLVIDLAELPPVVASEGRLSQVFVNLLVNAAQAVGGIDGPHEVRVGSAVVGGNVVIEVIDSGPGLTPEVAARAFDPFFTTKPTGEGTGLGLSICHAIVTGYGGTIELLPRRDARGTIARVTLHASDEAVTHRRRRAANASIATAAYRVLIVDDDRHVRAAFKRMLREHELTLAGSGVEALAAIDHHEFDVIVCDLMMPEMSGMELFDVLRRRNPAQARKVLFVTGGAFTEEARRFLDSVTNPQLDKPVDPRRLRAAVQAVGAAHLDRTRVPTPDLPTRPAPGRSLTPA